MLWHGPQKFSRAKYAGGWWSTLKLNAMPKRRETIHYNIRPHDLALHLFEVVLTVSHPDPEGQVLSLPAWIPGSYMIREFARNIVQIRAEADGRKLRLTKLDKHTWRATRCNGELSITYQVYAWDLSVRAAHLDQTHGFLNGTSVFLKVHGKELLPHVVDIQPPEGEAYAGWRVATSLPELKARRHRFGSYIAQDYDELIDHPVEMGEFNLIKFEAHGVPHEMAITGRVPNLDTERLAHDLQRICEHQISLFEPRTKRAPMSRYVFLTLAVGDGYGGLEHRASTALICARSDLPVMGQAELSDGYRSFLGLCSHEYFHTWNVKRIKPAVFAPYDLTQENYTPLLWLFEGFTSYYDDLTLVRTGLIDRSAYLGLLVKTINAVNKGSGRLKQSVAESSFDAWTKYYRQDENAPNAIVSYYQKGSLVALWFDLLIRSRTRGKRSLDDVMRALWRHYGRDFYQDGRGVGVSDADVEALFDEVTGLSLKTVFDYAVRGTKDLPLTEALAAFAIQLQDRPRKGTPSLGVRMRKEGADCKLASVYEGGAAHHAGLSAGDTLVALDDLRITASNLDSLLARYRIGDVVVMHAFRRDELMTFEVSLQPDTAPQVTLAMQEKPVAGVKLRDAWLKLR
jgi:predicted metalloprotease with PDZ domain